MSGSRSTINRSAKLTSNTLSLHTPPLIWTSMTLVSSWVPPLLLLWGEATHETALVPLSASFVKLYVTAHQTAHTVRNLNPMKKTTITNLLNWETVHILQIVSAPHYQILHTCFLFNPHLQPEGDKTVQGNIHGADQAPKAFHITHILIVGRPPAYRPRHALVPTCEDVRVLVDKALLRLDVHLPLGAPNPNSVPQPPPPTCWRNSPESL